MEAIHKFNLIETIYIENISKFQNWQNMSYKICKIYYKESANYELPITDGFLDFES
jgi:hypothetical protein